LDESPKPGISGKVFKWVIPAIILGVFIVGFIYGEGVGPELIWAWILANGICSAVGTAIALGHPVSIIAAFIAAPITSLNPTIGAGIVVGYVEARFRKPTVADIENLPEDFQTAKGWWRNKVTRTLLVFLFSGLGSAVGTWVAVNHMSDIFKSL
jgi:pheromone shutdown protein TraB